MLARFNLQIYSVDVELAALTIGIDEFDNFAFVLLFSLAYFACLPASSLFASFFIEFFNSPSLAYRIFSAPVGLGRSLMALATAPVAASMVAAPLAMG